MEGINQTIRVSTFRFYLHQSLISGGHESHNQDPTCRFHLQQRHVSGGHKSHNQGYQLVNYTLHSADFIFQGGINPINMVVKFRILQLLLFRVPNVLAHILCYEIQYLDIFCSDNQGFQQKIIPHQRSMRIGYKCYCPIF